MLASLRTRLALSFIALALFGSIIITLGLGRAATYHLQRATGNHLQELAYEMTDRLDRGMFERHQDIQLLAKLDILRNPSTPNTQRQALIEELQKTFPPYAWIGYASPDGEVLASTGGLLEGANVASREWFQRAKRTAFVGDVHDAVLLAKLLPRTSNEPLRFVDVSTPIQDERGKLIGVLGAHLSWTWAREVQQALLRPTQDRDEIDVLVLSRDHTVLLGPTDLQGKKLRLALMQRDGLLHHAVERWPDGQTYVTGLSVSQGYGDYPGLGWQVVTRQHENAAFATITTFQRQAFIAALLVSLLLGAAGVLGAHSITRPLARLTSSARRINAGVSDVTVPQSRAYAEVQQLSQALRSLVTTLESRVQERTQALEASTNRAAALSELSQAATLNIQPEAMISHAVQILTNHCSVNWVGLATVVDDIAEHRTVYTRPGATDLLVTGGRTQRGDGLLWTALERRSPLFVADYPAQVHALPQFVSWGARSAAILPIIAHIPEARVLIFARQEHTTWTQDERTLLTAATGVLGIAFERQAHQQYLERAALEDPLTGLHNRRAFDLDLELALSGARRHDHPLAVIMIDLDGLKTINDAEGHERGDALLQQFAGDLQVTFRGNDRAYRLGGDEYALLLTHASPEHVGILLKRVGHTEELTRAAGFTCMGASAGIAFYPSDAQTPSELVRRADERMYEDKSDRKILRRTSVDRP